MDEDARRSPPSRTMRSVVRATHMTHVNESDGNIGAWLDRGDWSLPCHFPLRSE